MIRKQVALWSWVIVLITVAILIYLLTTTSPYLSDNELNSLAVFSFILSLAFCSGAVGTLFCLLLHRRWPGLSGQQNPVGLPDARAAVRQGLLFALGVNAIALLALFRILDIAFVMVAIVLIGLLEISLQGQ